MSTWQIALQVLPSQFLSDEEKAQIAYEIIVNKKYTEDIVNSLVAATEPIGHAALATALRNLLSTASCSYMRPCAHGTLGSLLKSHVSLQGVFKNLCAPVKDNVGVYAADLYEPIHKLQMDGEYGNWQISHVQDVLNCLGGKTHVKVNGHVDGDGAYQWYCDELDKMFEAYPEQLDQWDPSYTLVSIPGQNLPLALPPFPSPPADLQFGSQWFAGNIVENRSDLIMFGGNNVARNRESRAAFMATVLGVHPTATFLVFDLAHLPKLYP